MVVLVLAASITGLVAGYVLSALRLNQLMVVIYHAPFRFWRPYLALYDGLENKYTYELLGGEKRFGSHAEFLKKYRSFRPEATKRFKALWDSYARKVGRDCVLVLIVGLALFWGVWWAFVGSFVVVQFVAIIRLRYVKRYRADFFAATVVNLLLQNKKVTY